ncbi:MAG: sigma-54-dependent Fis family transcriptional regulator [Alphaproteobacteria bacterium]|jgi:two-component system response regulator FlrC|nr:sigma-54-dependent Fis family transcriptional regulator [Alphaproteobacteria bacterium]
MSQVIVVNNNLKIANNLCNILESRDVTVIKAGSDDSKPNFLGIDLVGYQADTVVCSDFFEKEVGGSSKLVAIARQAKLSKIIIITEDSSINGIETKHELGGAVRRVSISDFTDQYTLELVFNMCCPDISFSAGDIKTYELLSLAKRVANTDVTVFINGPTGSGKEVLANYLHENSNRKGEPFVAVNCAAIPENMLEAILFGHEKGAFTGASNANKGIFRAADKGTLLLDEISEMPLSLQAKLLRVLQERKVTPVGGQRDIDVDVRVLATSNRDMASEVNQSRFREDLYYRLNVFPLQTRNLSARKDDILPISIKILNKHYKENDAIPYMTNCARDLLLNHSWPGNVRELENTLQRALVLSQGHIIDKNSIMIDQSLSNISNHSSVDTFADQLAFAKIT